MAVYWCQFTGVLLQYHEYRQHRGKLTKGLPSKDCVLPVQVGARPERDEASRKKTSLKTRTCKSLETHEI